jgi:hypothetical protein
MSALENDLALWIDDQISYLPHTVNLAYLEYNIGISWLKREAE